MEFSLSLSPFSLFPLSFSPSLFPIMHGCLSVCPSDMPARLSVCPSVRLFVRPSVCLSVRLSVYLLVKMVNLDRQILYSHKRPYFFGEFMVPVLCVFPVKTRKYIREQCLDSDNVCTQEFLYRYKNDKLIFPKTLCKYFPLSKILKITRISVA